VSDILTLFGSPTPAAAAGSGRPGFVEFPREAERMLALEGTSKSWTAICVWAPRSTQLVQRFAPRRAPVQYTVRRIALFLLLLLAIS